MTSSSGTGADAPPAGNGPPPPFASIVPTPLPTLLPLSWSVDCAAGPAHLWLRYLPAGFIGRMACVSSTGFGVPVVVTGMVLVEAAAAIFL